MCVLGEIVKMPISGPIKGILSLKIKLILNENLGKNIKIVLWHFRENSPCTEKIRLKEKQGKHGFHYDKVEKGFL